MYVSRLVLLVLFLISWSSNGPVYASVPIPRTSAQAKSIPSSKPGASVPKLLLGVFPQRLSQATPKPPPNPPKPPPAKPSTNTVVLIKEIKIVGLQRLKPQQARRWIFSQEQEVFSKKKLAKDVARLQRTGYFRGVRTRVSVKNGWATITFMFQEHIGRIRAIYFYGSQNFTQAQLYSFISMRPGMSFNRRALERDARQVINAYHNLGYFKVKVTVQGRWTGQTLLLWFVIQENAVAKIRRVILRGNRSIPSEKLLSVLDSKAYTIGNILGQRGFFHPSFVARDLYFLRNYYFDRGYIQNKITGPQVYASRDKEWVTLTYNIIEGPQYRYGDIQIFGDLIRPRTQLRKLLRLKTGDVFNRTGLYRQNIVPLLRFYRDQGYAYARIQTLPQIEVKKRTVSLQFQVNKGPLVRVERIEIQGNTTTTDFVIRRRILIKEGDLFSETKLLRSQAFLFGSGFFQATDPQRGIKVVKIRGTKPNRLILRFIVKEKSTWIYNIGFSFLNPFGFIFTGRLGKSNLFGRGQTLVGSGAISTTLRLWQVNLTFFDPHVADTDLSLYLGGYVTHRDSSSSVSAGFLRDSVGANLSLGHHLGVRTVRASLAYRIAYLNLSPAGGQTFNVPIANYFTQQLSSSFKLRVSWDTRNTAIGTSKGFQIYGTYEFAHPYFGSDYTLHRVEGGARFYFKLPLNSIFKFAVTAGWSYSPDANGVPPFERYPLDGSYFLLRGFEPNSVGPLRTIPSSGEASFQKAGLMWGGNKKFLFNMEWIIPIWNALKLGGVLFFDAGNAFDDNEFMFQDLRNDFLPIGLFMNVGFGFRWVLPGVGVARFEFGIPLTRRPTDPIVFFNFLVGESF